MYVNPASLGSGNAFDNEWNRMVGSGVESARTSFNWAGAQRYHSLTDVPGASKADYLVDPQHHHSIEGGVNGVPTDFTGSDQLVEAAAQRNITLLPVVIQAPGWAASEHRALPHPKNPKDYANYLTALVHRYGPNGTFWTLFPDVPKHPIQEWQIWNEPNIPHFWGGNWARPYRDLLKAAHDAVKNADPHAKIVLAGLSNAVGSISWKSLDNFYKLGTRNLFDVVTVHPYTRLPSNVVKIAKLIRTVMNRRGDRRKPQMITELSWPSAGPGKKKSNADYGFNVSENGQAADIRAVYPMLAKVRRSLNIARVYWYTWASSEKGRKDPFDYAGLRKSASPDSRAKPSFGAWQHVVLSLEGCKRPKSSVTRCG
jgi:hypothetical protein